MKTKFKILKIKNKELENVIFVYRKDIKDLHWQLSEQSKELNSKIKESKTLKDEKNTIEEILNELKKRTKNIKELNNMNNKNINSQLAFDERVFSTRSYKSPSSANKLKKINTLDNISTTSCSKIETELLQFMIYLENKGLPVINIFKDEFHVMSERKLTVISDIMVNEIRWKLFKSELPTLLNQNNANLLNSKKLKQDFPPIISLQDVSLKNIKDNKQISQNKPQEIQYGTSSKPPNKPNELRESMKLSFRSEDSFKAITSGSPIKQEKPSWVPVLDFTHLPEYIDSNDLRFHYGKVNIAAPDY